MAKKKPTKKKITNTYTTYIGKFTWEITDDIDNFLGWLIKNEAFKESFIHRLIREKYGK